MHATLSRATSTVLYINKSCFSGTSKGRSQHRWPLQKTLYTVILRRGPQLPTLYKTDAYSKGSKHWKRLEKAPKERSRNSINVTLVFLLVGWIHERWRNELSVPIRIVEGYCINHILVALQCVQLLSGCGVPHLARPIIASCDEANTENVNALHGENDRRCAHGSSMFSVFPHPAG